MNNKEDIQTFKIPLFRGDLNAIEAYFLRTIENNVNFTRLITDFRVHINQCIAHENVLQITVYVLQAKYQEKFLKKNLKRSKVKSK
jgi:hypothetical protein